MILSLADINIEVAPKYSFIKELAKDYTSKSDRVDFSVSVDDADIELEAEMSEGSFSKPYLESIALYRKIAERLPMYDAFVFHGAVVAYGGSAYAFTARSGVGKTTHIRLWHKLLGDAVHVLNGDKPILRMIDGTPYASGTPWRGKENYGVPGLLPLSSVGFISRAPSPSVKKITPAESMMRFVSQIYVPTTPREAARALSTLNKVISGVSLFDVYATMDIESARLSFNALTNKTI